MAAKITLDDGRIFEVGQKVEWNDNLGFWNPRKIIAYGRGDSSVSVDSLLTAPKRVRHIAPKTITKVQRTMREVDEIINLKRYEWRRKGGDYSHLGGDVVSRTDMDTDTDTDTDTDIGIGLCRVRSCEYRTSPKSEWLDLEFKGVEV